MKKIIWCVCLLVGAVSCTRAMDINSHAKKDVGLFDGGLTAGDASAIGDSGHSGVDGASSIDGDVNCAHPAVVANCQNGWCSIPAGCFQMGSPPEEGCRYAAAENRHAVTLTHGFVISATEVTQSQFQSAAGYNPSAAASCGGDCPVEQVTWSEAAAYCNFLSTGAGLAQCYSCSNAGSPNAECSSSSSYQTIYDCPGYRLPTDAEWEYAYRAGTGTAFYSGDVQVCIGHDSVLDPIAWYWNNSGGVPHSVGLKQANAWGLYDMAGNVWEWVNDGFVGDLGASAVSNPLQTGSGADRVTRGGSFGPDDCCAVTSRAAFRGFATASNKHPNRGFRCVKSM